MFLQCVLRRPAPSIYFDLPVIVERFARVKHRACLLLRSEVFVVGPERSAEECDAVELGCSTLEQVNVGCSRGRKVAVRLCFAKVQAVVFVVPGYVDDRLAV